MKFKSFLLCAIAIAFPITVSAAAKKNNDRWFEIEIILFSQIGDKSQLKEHFPDTSELPKYRRTLDLLTHYLNPNIASLKQLLPSCESPQYQADLVTQKAKLPELFTEKTLAQLHALSTENSISNHVLSELATNTIQNHDSDTTDSTIRNELPPEFLYQDKAKIQALVLAAEQEFSEFTFQYTTNNIHNARSKLLCRIDEENFADIKADDPNFNYNGFTVEKMPVLIDAVEDINSQNTYLLSQESLQLGDVIKDLRYSKDFRPILHMGWRQVARPQKQSIPIKVYAGDNFSADHQKKLNRFEQKQLALKELHSSINSDVDNLETTPKPGINVIAAAKQLESIKKSRIADIVAQISQVPEDTEQLLTSLNNNDLSLTIDHDDPLINSTEIMPSPPIQDWFIEGLFNVHLKHYLFITADFNILDKSLAELATTQVSTLATGKADTQPVQAKAIRFKQNRRVISGEVHYFDHPYMGMVVQIRPYKKPEPPQGTETELDLTSSLTETH